VHFRIKEQNGFSLIEMMIYLAVSSTLLLVVFSFTREVLKVRNKITIESKVEQNARFALARMVNEIRFADDISVIDQNTLSLTVSEPSRNPVVFDLSDGMLCMQEGAGPCIALTGNDVKVGEVLFDDRTTPNSGNIVKISLSVTHPDTNLSPDSQASIEVETYVTNR